jgi:DNA-binding beta-propeller fold protein YncE
VAVDPIARKVYIGGTETDQNGIQQSEVIEFCTVTKKVDGQVHVSSTSGDGIQGIAVNSATGAVYVSNGSDNEIDVLQHNKVQSRISLTAEPFGVAVNPFSNQIYAALLDGTVSLINGATNSVTTNTATNPPAPLASANAGIAIDVVGGNVYTTNAVYANASTLGVLSAANALITNVSVGNTPFGVGVDPITSLVFVANSQDGTVDVVNGTTNTISKTLPVSGLFLAVNLFSEKVYVGANDSTPTITVISEK